MYSKDDIEAIAVLLWCNNYEDCALDDAIKGVALDEDYMLQAESILFTLYANGWRKCAPPDDTFKQHDHEHHV